MSNRIPVVSGKTLMKFLATLGFFLDRQRGSHCIMENDVGKSVSVPNKKTIGKGLLHKILKDAGSDVVELNKFLGRN